MGATTAFIHSFAKTIPPRWLVAPCPEQMTFAYKTTTHSSNKSVASQLPWSFGKCKNMRYLSYVAGRYQQYFFYD